MKEFFIFLTIIATTQAISGGTDADFKLHKSILSLRYKGNHFCGASLIDKDWAVTSASCLDIYSTNLSVQGGSNDLLSNNVIKVDVKSFVVYPYYNNETYEDDIALLNLATSIDTNDSINTAYLPFYDISDIPVGEEIAITGWGLTESDGNYSQILQTGYSKVIARPECVTGFPDITLNQGCAGDVTVQNVTACDGDFGGQVTLENCLKGIIVWSASCGESPNVYLLLASYKKWILDTTGIDNYQVCPN